MVVAGLIGASLMAWTPAQPLARSADPVEIAAPSEPTQADPDDVAAPAPRPIVEHENLDPRPKMPDPYRRKIGTVLLAAGAVSFVGVIAAQAAAPWKWRHCYFLPKEDRTADSYSIPGGLSSYRAGLCPYTTLASWAHPIAMIGTLAASLLAGIGSSRFGEAHGARRARADLAPRGGAVRLAIGGTLTAAGLFGVVASAFIPDSRSGRCEDAECMRRLSVASSIGVSISATSAVVGSGLLGHALGERRAARRPGHIAYGLAGDRRGLQLSVAARF